MNSYQDLRNALLPEATHKPPTISHIMEGLQLAKRLPPELRKPALNVLAKGIADFLQDEIDTLRMDKNLSTQEVLGEKHAESHLRQTLATMERIRRLNRAKAMMLQQLITDATELVSGTNPYYDQQVIMLIDQAIEAVKKLE